MTQRQGQEGGGKNVLFGIDTSDLLLSAVQDVGEYAGYPRTLGALAPLLTARYGTGRLRAATLVLRWSAPGRFFSAAGNIL